MSGIVKSKLGYYGNFGLGIGLISICLAYTIFFLEVTPEVSKLCCIVIARSRRGEGEKMEGKWR